MSADGLEIIEKPSHLCVADMCEFGRTTLIPIGYFVSTVGEYRDKRTGTIEMIGCDRLYESMVFRWDGTRCEIPDCGCGRLPNQSSLDEIDFLPANTREDAIRNHDQLVKKWRVVPAGKDE